MKIVIVKKTRVLGELDWKKNMDLKQMSTLKISNNQIISEIEEGEKRKNLIRKNS